jgi:hypothetical protein
MICTCGNDLGRVTLKTPGLCLKCGRSKWLQACRAHRPRSQAIADGLNRRFAPVCVHNTTTCITRCGVRMVNGTMVHEPVVKMVNGQWEPMSQDERETWFKDVNAIQCSSGKGPIV